ncbi:unnamed protein product [Ectocarpus fasciculatus]
MCVVVAVVASLFTGVVYNSSVWPCFVAWKQMVRVPLPVIALGTLCPFLNTLFLLMVRSDHLFSADRYCRSVRSPCSIHHTLLFCRVCFCGAYTLLWGIHT